MKHTLKQNINKVEYYLHKSKGIRSPCITKIPKFHKATISTVVGQIPKYDSKVDKTFQTFLTHPSSVIEDFA